MMKTCPQCGVNIGDLAEQCGPCYRKTLKGKPRRQPRAWTCIGCGKPVARKVKRCAECGTAFMKAKGAPNVSAAGRRRGIQKLKAVPHTWAIGKKRSAATRKRQSAAWTPAMKEAARERGLLRAENREWLVRIAEALSGENNPNYQGKDSATPYGPGWGRGYKAKLKAKANGVCERCGKPKKWLDLHHKDFSKDNHAPDNIGVVCRSCHKLLHSANSRKTKASSA